MLAIVMVGVLIVRRPDSVQRVTLEQRDVVSTLAVVGRVRVPMRVKPSVSATGTVTAVLVEECDRVNAGDLLVSLEAAEAQANVRQAEAALPEVRASTRQLIEDAEREVVQPQRDADRASYESSDLSEGQKQRVAIACALVIEPDLVLPDEPTGNLDTESTAQVMELVQSFNRQPRTAFFLVTHVDSIARRCRRVVHLVDGLIESDQSGTLSPAART